jgi:hypothetical protein
MLCGRRSRRGVRGTQRSWTLSYDRKEKGKSAANYEEKIKIVCTFDTVRTVAARVPSVPNPRGRR